MPDESFFMAFGGLGLSLAGFAGLIAALIPHPANPAVAAYRIRTIVVLGFSLTFVGFGTVAVHTVTGDVTTAIRVGTALMAIPFGRGLLIDTRSGPMWPVESERRITLAIVLLLLAGTVGNIVVANVGYLLLLMLAGLLGPVTIFYNTIRDATGGDAATRPAPNGPTAPTP